MSEFQPSPEAELPYDTALDEFFGVLDNNAASETHLRTSLAGLFSVAAGNGVHAATYINNWSERHAYDARGIVADSDLYADTQPGEASEADVLNKKLALLGDVGAFFMASPYSLLSDEQKEGLMYRVGAFFEVRNRSRALADTFGAALAPYVAHEIDMIELYNDQNDRHNPDRENRIARGRFVLRIANRVPYLRNDIGWALSKGLRRARTN